MRHVPPHLWADAERGRLSERRVARMREHLARCARCERERERVCTALGAFSDMRATEAPDLRWEHVGARIYWVTSSERRNAELRAARPGWRRMIWPGLALSAALALLAWRVGDHLSTAPSERDSSTAPAAESRAAPRVAGVEFAPAPEGAAAKEPLGPDATAVPATPLVGIVTLLEGTARRAGQDLDMHASIERGDRISTDTGQISIQFGKDESVTLGPATTLDFAAFDGAAVELEVHGELVADLGPRRPEQRFVVRAGERRVVVRGTLFAVENRPGWLRVSCVHGRVDVLDAQGQVEIQIAGGESVEWRAADDQAMVDAVPNTGRLSDEARADIERRRVRVPTWAGDARAWAEESTAILDVRAPGDEATGAAVEVDGVWLASGSFKVRVLPGRHLVRRDGHEGAWYPVEVGQTARVVAARDESRQAHVRARRVRREQLLAAIGQGARLHGCVSALRKQDLLDGTFIELDMRILGDGTINYLNIASTNLQPTAAKCVRDVIDGVEFPSGPRVELRHRIDW